MVVRAEHSFGVESPIGGRLQRVPGHFPGDVTFVQMGRANEQTGGWHAVPTGRRLAAALAADVARPRELGDVPRLRRACLLAGPGLFEGSRVAGALQLRMDLDDSLLVARQA